MSSREYPVGVTMVAKFGKEKIELLALPPSTTILEVKWLLRERTGILPKRQKLIGLSLKSGGGRSVADEAAVGELEAKKGGLGADGIVSHRFILMGTPEEKIFVDPGEKDDLPDVVDDFDLDFDAGSDEWVQHVANEENLRKFTETTAVHVMHPPRGNKPLLVLDLDHTLLDFSAKSLRRSDEPASRAKRPHMDHFLSAVYPHYDLVVWSQTSWRWLETKLTELGMLAHPGYRFCFVLDKTSMFKIVSFSRGGQKVHHHVKPLQIIWSKFPSWGPWNTVHLDDLASNFALNLGSGLKVSPFYRKRKAAKTDCQLLGLANYLVQVAQAQVSFQDIDFHLWMDVVSGNQPLLKEHKQRNDRKHVS